MQNQALKVVARIHSDFPTKFGIPRQSNLVTELQATVIFEPEYRNPDALRGLDGFSYIWLIWGFSAVPCDTWSPTVRPPRLGGNARMGVFASRSPFRPNSIAISSVKLESIEHHPTLGPLLHVSGADLMDGSPIYDIKPYLPHVDSHPEATAGFADLPRSYHLAVECADRWLELLPADRRRPLLAVLAEDPRPSYHDDPERIYGFEFAGFNIRFRVAEGTLTVCEIVPLRP